VSTVIWRGGAQSVPQVNTVTLGGTVTVGSTFSVTVNGKTLTVTAATTSAADAAAALRELIAGSAEGEFQELSATVAGPVVTLTGPDDGRPFTQTSGAGGAGAPTCVTATATAGSGPNDWGVPANWGTGAVPVNGDDVAFDGTSQEDCRYGLDQHLVTLASLTVSGGYNGTVGLPPVNEDGGYPEYRGQYLRIGVNPGVANVGEGDGGGPALFRLDTGAVALTLNLFSGTATWKGANGATVVNRSGGTLGVAAAAGESAALNRLNVLAPAAGGVFGTPAPGGGSQDVTVGAGVTLATLEQAGGSVLCAASVTTVTLDGGTLTLVDAAAVTNGPAVRGGTVNWNSTGSLGTAAVFGGAKLDASGDLRAKAAAAVLLYRGATYLDPNQVVSNVCTVRTVGCKIADVTWDGGADATYTRS
jgi:hypothetical protein